MKSFRLVVQSRADQLAKIAAFVEKIAAAYRLSEQHECDVEMAVDEACANIIEHAYQGQPDGKIVITCARRGKDLLITIKDFGKPFDPTRVARPRTRAPLSKRNVGGLGLFLMRRRMDQVTFDFSKEHNVLTMVKRIK
jgi:serine/threonine-protein kinase RsbW